MLSTTETARKLLEETTRFEVFSEVLMDIEVNGYVDYTIEFPESIEPNLFPGEEVLKTRRPSGGLPKLVTPTGKFSSTDISDLCYTKSNNWYRLPSKESNYKYYRSKAVSGPSSPFDFDQPLEFIVNYSQSINFNKLVVGFEYASALPDDVEVFFYSNDSWQSIGQFSVPSDGILTLSYNGSWSESDTYLYQFTTTTKIKLVVSSMNLGNSAVEIIQISPRMSIDISDRITSVSVNKQSTESDLVSPIGTSNSNSASINIANEDGFFNNDNQSSAIYGLIDVNVKFTITDLVSDDGESFERIPSAVVFSNSWNVSSQGTVGVDCSDKSKFLQGRSIENSFYANKDLRFVIADILERAEIVDYEICFAESDTEYSPQYLFFKDDQTVWESLQKIALAEQAFYYFDESGKFVWISRDYWWQSQDLDYELLSRSSGLKLPNLIDYSVAYTNVINKATINYSPAEILKQGDRYVNNFIWEQSDPIVLQASPLLSDINQSSQYFLIDSTDYALFPEEGIVNIDAEYIKYSKKTKKITSDQENIGSTIEKFSSEVEVAVLDAATRESVDVSEVQILYIQEVVWPDTSIGCPQEFRSYSNILVDGYFIIINVPGPGGDTILQYNASLTQNPFLCAVLQSDSSVDYSYWTVSNTGEEAQVDFIEGSEIFVPPNALFIEERGVFNSSPTIHNFGVDGTESVFTYKNTPPEIVVESPRIVYDSIENSNLKLRTNTIDSDLIHHYSPNRSGKYGVFGAEFTFPIFVDENDIRYDGQGIAGIFINKGAIQSGYYVEFTNSEYARLSTAGKREVSIWKYAEDGSRNVISGYLPEDILTLDFQDLVQIAGSPVDIFPGVKQKISIFVDDIEELVFEGEDSTVVPGINITVAVNGRKILAVDDLDVDGNTVYTQGDWGVFARSNTAVDFEYIYAIDRNNDSTLIDKSRMAIREQISGGFIDNTLEYFLDEQNGLRNSFAFEDFGGWVREILEIDTEHEIVPATSSQIFASNESKIYFVYKNLDQFSSRFAIGNRLREPVVVSGDDPITGTNMVLSVYGVPLNQSETKNIKRSNDSSVWRRGEEEIIVDSPWVQNKQKAERIADWIVQRWSSPSEFIDTNVVIDPRIQVGDLATITIPENSITPETHKFHVVAVQKTTGTSPSMSVRLRRAHF